MMGHSPETVRRVRERDVKIVALAANGMPPCAIAREIGVRRALVSARLHRARKRGEAVPRFDGRGRRAGDGDIAFALDGADLHRLRALAEARGLSPARLAHEIVAAALRDDIVAAVLDR